MNVPPHDCTVLRLVLGPANGVLCMHLNGVFGARNLDHHILGIEQFFKNGFHLDDALDFAVIVASGPGVLVENGHHLKRQVYIFVDAVASLKRVRHEVEGAIGGDEGDRAVLVKFAQTHALVEFDVIDVDAAVHAPAIGFFFHQQLVVHAEFALRHVRQLRFHPHETLDFGAQHRAYLIEVLLLEKSTLICSIISM